MIIISVIGEKNTGKTTFLKGLVASLSAGGLRVGVIKHHYGEFSMDTEGKDSDVLRKAGAVRSAVCNDYKISLADEGPGPLNLHEIARKYFSDLDILFTEGYKKETTMKIEVVRRGFSAGLLEENRNDVLFYVSDAPLDTRLPVYGHGDYEKCTRAVLSFYNDSSSGKEDNGGVELYANGEQLPLKTFIAGFFRDVNLGLLKNLKGYGSDREIVIKIKPRRQENKGGTKD